MQHLLTALYSVGGDRLLALIVQWRFMGKEQDLFRAPEETGKAAGARGCPRIKSVG
jgi:hypothetical protein